VFLAGQIIYAQLDAGAIAGTVKDSTGAAPYPANQGPSDWFNNAAFSAPAAYIYGNAGRNCLRGPTTFDNDLGLQFNLEFTAQASNPFSTPQFNLPNNRVGISTTGVITTVVTPERQLRLGLHLTF